jgi:hypothetical protein
MYLSPLLHRRHVTCSGNIQLPAIQHPQLPPPILLKVTKTIMQRRLPLQALYMTAEQIPSLWTPLQVIPLQCLRRSSDFFAISPSTPSRSRHTPCVGPHSIPHSVTRRRRRQSLDNGPAGHKHRHAARDVWTFFEDGDSNRSCIFCKYVLNFYSGSCIYRVYEDNKLN